MGIQRIKCPFTLIEIAFTILLAPLLLISLLKMSTRLLETRRYLEKAQLAVHTKLLIQERLSSLLSSIHPTTLATPGGYTLNFDTCDLLDSDPAYSGAVPVKLFLKDHALTLTLLDREEILMEDVHSLSCELANWSPKHPSSPSFLRLTIAPSSDDPPFQFAFFIRIPEKVHHQF